MQPNERHQRLHTYSEQTRIHTGSGACFKINHIKTLTDHEDSKQWQKKTPQYFQFLKNQLIEARERKVFKLAPDLITQTVQVPIMQFSQPIKVFNVLSRNYRDYKQMEHKSFSTTMDLKWNILTLPKGKKKLQRSTSCTCSECAITNNKVKYAKCIQISQQQQGLPRIFYCEQHHKEAIRRRFRKLVICVQIVLYYKKNMHKIQKKRLKRLSMKNAAATVQHRPQQSFQQVITTTQQELSKCDDTIMQKVNDQKMVNLQLYFKNQSNNRALVQFIQQKEIKPQEDIKIYHKYRQQKLQTTHHEESLFVSLSQFQINQSLKKKSKSIQKICKDEVVEKPHVSIYDQRAKSGYMKSMQYQSQPSRNYDTSIHQNQNKFPLVSQQGQRVTELKIFTELRRGTQSQNKSRDKIFNKTHTLDSIIKIKQQVYK